jgi:hypothetical protein
VVRLGSAIRNHGIVHLARHGQVRKAVAVNVAELLSSEAVFSATEAVGERFDTGPGRDGIPDLIAGSFHWC